MNKLTISVPLNQWGSLHQVWCGGWGRSVSVPTSISMTTEQARRLAIELQTQALAADEEVDVER